MVTFIWPYYDGNAHFDELRWSIRSVLKYFQGDAFIHVVGDRPKWYSGSIEIVSRASTGRSFQSGLRDALAKWYRGVQTASGSHCVWMMDDCFFTKPFTLDDLLVHRASVKIGDANASGFQQAKQRTKHALIKQGKTTWDFVTHSPIAVERSQFFAFWDKYDITQNQLLWECAWGNDQVIGDPEPNNWFRYLSKSMPDEDLALELEPYHGFSTSNAAWKEPVRRFLYNDLQGYNTYETSEPIPPRPRQSEPSIVGEERWTPWGKGWTAPNGKSPEHEFTDFVSAIVRLNKPSRIIETGMGQGFITKAIEGARPKGSEYLIFESDPKFRKRPPICNCMVSDNQTPSADEIATASLLVLDSDPELRKQEIRLWSKYGKPGSTMIVHDVSDIHPNGAIHTQLFEHIQKLGISGSLLRNPRGGFIATKPFEFAQKAS